MTVHFSPGQGEAGWHWPGPWWGGTGADQGRWDHPGSNDPADPHPGGDMRANQVLPPHLHRAYVGKAVPCKTMLPGSGRMVFNILQALCIPQGGQGTLRTRPGQPLMPDSCSLVVGWDAAEFHPWLESGGHWSHFLPGLTSHKQDATWWRQKRPQLKGGFRSPGLDTLIGHQALMGCVCVCVCVCVCWVDERMGGSATVLH